MAAWRAIELLEDKAVEQEVLVQTAQTLCGNGHLRAARLAFERALGRSTGDAFIARLHHELVGEIEVLNGSWKPATLEFPRVDPICGRILHIVTNSVPYNQTGYALRTHYVAKAQMKARIDAKVVTPLGYPWSQNVLHSPLSDTVDQVCYYRLLPPEGIPSNVAERMSLHLLKLADLVQNLRPALLHAASDYPNALLAVELGRIFRLPVVYEVRGFWEETWLSKVGPAASTSERYIWWRERELECMLAADRVVTLAHAMKHEVMKRGVPAEKIVVIPNGVDNAMLAPVCRDAGLASQLGIDRNTTVIGYISTLSQYEGIRFLLEAVAKLIHRGRRLCALLVGDGEERRHLEAYAKSLGIEHSAIFAGHVPHTDIIRYYGLIDIFVVSRTADRVSQFVTPLKPFEAMAAGRAVVVSGLPALKEVVEDGVTGLVFIPEDSDDLARIVEFLTLNTERRRELGQKASEWVRQNRMWDKIGTLYLQLYQSMGVV